MAIRESTVRTVVLGCIGLVVLSVMVTSSSCSWVSYFVVVNYSDQEITLTYSLDIEKVWPDEPNHPCPLAPPYLDAPLIFSAKRLKLKQVLDSLESASEFSLSADTCTIELRLDPSQGVVVWESLSYDAAERPMERRFLTAVEIAGPDSVAKYEGPHLERQFTRRSKVLYAITYGGEADQGL